MKKILHIRGTWTYTYIGVWFKQMVRALGLRAGLFDYFARTFSRNFSALSDAAFRFPRRNGEKKNLTIINSIRSRHNNDFWRARYTRIDYISKQPAYYYTYTLYTVAGARKRPHTNRHSKTLNYVRKSHRGGEGIRSGWGIREFRRLSGSRAYGVTTLWVGSPFLPCRQTDGGYPSVEKTLVARKKLFIERSARALARSFSRGKRLERSYDARAPSSDSRVTNTREKVFIRTTQQKKCILYVCVCVYNK